LPKNQRRRRKPNPKAIGALLVDRTTTERIEEVFDEMAREGLSGSYIYRTWKHLDSALAWGVKTKRNRYNRADECSLPEGKPPKKGRPFSLDEARAFLDAATTDRLYALWITAVMVGQRPGELTGLRWANLDLESDEPSVDVTERAKYERGKYVGQAKPKTGRDGRIGLHSLAVAALLRWRQELIELGLFEPEGFVFPTENGGPHLQGNVRKYLRDVCKKARVDHDRTTYDLRRTFASIADDALQGNLKLVGKVMGHSGRNGERTTAGYVSGVRPVISHAVTAFDAFIEEQRKSNEDQELDAEDNVVESLSAEG
jgi:integrase